MTSAGKPLFRIEELIEALLQGSPDDPVYLKVGSSTYGIQSITDGQIRVRSGRDTQDAAQVVKTLRRYATGTPKGEDTGIAWRIVGVGGGTAIRSVSHDGSRIVVTTLAKEGKDAETFEAPKSERKTTPARRAHNAAVSRKVSQVMKDYDKTGKIGSSKPKNRAAALKQAVAVAYSMVNKEYSKSGKRLPAGVRRAEGEQGHPFDAPMGYGPDGPRPFHGNRRKLVRDRWGNLRFIRRRKDGTYMDNVDFGRSIRADRRRQARTWAPPGFRDQGDGSLDLLTSLMGAEGTDWNLEFGEDYDVSIPANPTENQEDLLDAFSSYQYYDSEYHDEILNRGLEIADETDFRKLLGACQQHDGIIDSSHPAEAYIIAISCYDALVDPSDEMAAEEFTLPDGSKVMVEDVSEINEGFEPFDLDGVDFIAWDEELFSMPVNCGICNGPSQYYEDNDNVCMTCDSTWVYDEGGDEGEGYYRRSLDLAAESGDFVWVLILDSDHFEDVLGGVFTSKDEAIEVFSDHLRGIGGDPDGINWDYDAMVWGHDEEDDPSLGEHSIRLYQEKLDDPDFSKYYAAEHA